MSLGDLETHRKHPTFCGRLHSDCQEFVFLQVHSHLPGTVMLSHFEMTFLMPSSRLAVSLSSEHSSPERCLVFMCCTSMLAQDRTQITILKPFQWRCSFHPSWGKGTHISLAVQCGPTEIKVGLLPLHSHSGRPGEKMPLCGAPI